ncbi:MAG: putative toxin-antitoxin system toxin component, PIN family [Clostridiales bacterium]|nr:putative toxin-antitoxin system toxin component, PIN family [Clostridiales bacterium]
MRIMLDTNILISMYVFKGMKDVIEKITQDHTMLLCSYVIDELHEVIEKKFPEKGKSVEEFLTSLPYEFIYTPKTIESHSLFQIRDKDDEKVLYSAIISEADILLTGDKDFSDVEIEKPEILTPKEFLEKY